MTPNPTDQDVAALVARLTERWESSASPVTRKINRLLATCREAATALSTLAAERSENAKEALAAQGQADESYQRWVASEARAERAEAEIDGLAALNKGYHTRLEASEARATALEAEIASLRRSIGLRALEGHVAEIHEIKAQLARAREAMNAGLAYLTGNMDGDWNGEGDPIELLREALQSPAPADGRGEDDGVASASCPQEPSLVETLQRTAGALQLLLSQPKGRRGDSVVFTGEWAHLKSGSYDDILDDAEVALGRLLAGEGREEACRDGCQYSKDVGMWPEHSCANGCVYKRERPATAQNDLPNLADATQKITQTGDRDE